MDPNRILLDLRAWAIGTITLSDSSDDADLQELASIAQQLLDLDRWLTSGGFLPTAWRPTAERPIDRLNLTKAQYNLARDHEINHQLAAAAREHEYNAHIDDIAKAVLAMKVPRGAFDTTRRRCWGCRQPLRIDDTYVFDDKELCGPCADKRDPDFVKECEEK